MDLSTVLLICAVVAGLSGGFAARYRRWGTAIADLIVGALVASLFSVVALVILMLAAGLDIFGIMHFAYLLIVVGFPLGAAWIVVPHLLDADRRTPLVVWLMLPLSIGAVAIGLWATHVEPFRLQVDSQILGATGATEPIVIGVIADLQTTSIGSHEQAALEAVLEGDPDIVVLPGDLFQLEPDELAEALPAFVGWLRTLTDAVEHVVVVNGNVDFTETVEDLAEEVGAIYLADDLTTISVRGQQVTVVGLAVVPGRPKDEIDPELFELVRRSTNEQDLVLAISHYPDPVLSLNRDMPVDLFVAGHTHGGQVALPRIGPLITFSDVPRVVASGGLHVVNGFPIYVSTGVGLERGQAPQVRFGVPPSVALLTIVPS